jgi:hypothetical protein
VLKLISIFLIAAHAQEIYKPEAINWGVNKLTPIPQGCFCSATGIKNNCPRHIFCIKTPPKKKVIKND